MQAVKKIAILQEKRNLKIAISVEDCLDKNSDFGYDIEKEGIMMFKRKIYNQLLQWKEESQGRTALLIEGARRVGKSTVVEEFGKNEYESYILIDFSIASQTVKNLFGDLSDLNFFLPSTSTAL